MTKFKPHGQRILVEPVSSGASVGSLVIPENAREQRPAEAVVVALGANVKIETDDTGRLLTVGDRVFTSRYEGEQIKVKGRMHRLLKPEDLLAVIAQ